MRYYVTADVHGYFSELKTALTQIGFFDDNEPHKLIICGDIYDRGSEPLQLQEFILELLSKDEIILIKGNHDDLALELLHNWQKGSCLQYFHHTNGTIDTVCRLTGFTVKDMYSGPEEVRNAFRQNDYIQKIIPSMLDYFETEHYIFTHGWIPCTPIRITSDKNEYAMIEDWRNAESKAWDKARWINGMEAAHSGVIENNKTIQFLLRRNNLRYSFISALAEDNNLAVKSLATLEKKLRGRNLHPMFITGHTGWTDNIDFAFAHKNELCSPFRKKIHDPKAPYDAYDESDDTEEKAKSGYLEGYMGIQE